jgi:hypothetical protein
MLLNFGIFLFFSKPRLHLSDRAFSCNFLPCYLTPYRGLHIKPLAGRAEQLFIAYPTQGCYPGGFMVALEWPLSGLCVAFTRADKSGQSGQNRSNPAKAAVLYQTVPKHAKAAS